MPQPQTQEVYRQGLGGMDAWTRHQHFIENYVKFYNDKPSSTQETHSITEREILHENHRFLRSESDDQDLTWEKRIAKKYYDKLFKEYALVELKYYKEGRVAMRWRTQKEVVRGKGQFTCGNLRCDESKGLESWEVNFGYVEQGEKKNALVKIRLCERCSYKLNYKSTHKRANPSQEDGSLTSSVTVAAATGTTTESLKPRNRSSSRDRAPEVEGTESSQHPRRHHELTTRSKRRNRSHSRDWDYKADTSESSRLDHRDLSKRRKSSSRRDEDKPDGKDRVRQSESLRSPPSTSSRSPRDYSRSHSTSDRHDKQDDREGRGHSRSKSVGDRERSRRSDADDEKRGANYSRVKETTEAGKAVDHGSTVDKGSEKRNTDTNEDSNEKTSRIGEFESFFKGLFE